jgi:serine/threonine protein kinase
MEIANSVGTIIAARYQLAELLGEGVSGSTYRAIRLEDGAAVAIKILSLRHLNDWKQLELFEREAKVLSQLNHPQIPKYLDYFHVDTPENRAFYIVQQLAPGKPLTAWVQAGWRGTEADVRDIASQLLEILQYLHQHSPPLIHRDLKPHNIIRNEDGRVFLVDFGAVQDVYNNTLLKGSTVAGTFGYMAPEQFRGLAVPASDLYGLGATILYLLTHRSPADLPQARLKLSFRAHVNISEHFADWLEKMLEPDTSERFPSADVALDALKKQHRFRVQRGHKIGFPWKGVAIAAIILSISVSLIDRYRYTFLTKVGLVPNGLCEAIGRNDVESLHKYISQGGDVNTEVEFRHWNNENDQYGRETGSLLHCAIEHRQNEITAYLIKNGADLHSDSNKQSPLMLALETANDSAVRYLIQSGVNPNRMEDTDKRSSAWHFLAWHHGNDKKAIQSISEQLIAAKVDINKQDKYGDTPLHVVIQSDNQTVIGVLLKHKTRTDIRNERGDTALFAAIRTQNPKTVELLISLDAGINIPNKDGKTPLMIAMEEANSSDRVLTEKTFDNSIIPILDPDRSIQKIIKLLIDKGADPNIADQNGNTTFHLLGNLGEVRPNPDSCDKGRLIAIYTLELLMRHKVNFQAVNKDGDTALHVLAKQDFFPVIDRMIRYGWNPLQKNRQGKNIYQLMKVAMPRESRCKKSGNN